MNEEIYTMDRLKIGFVLLYMNEKEARDWWELYLESIEDPATGKLVYPTFGAFLAEVCKAFWSADRMQTGELETGQEDSRTNCYRIQTIDWTSRTDNKVDVRQYPLDWVVLKNPELFPCPQNHVQ